MLNAFRYPLAAVLAIGFLVVPALGQGNVYWQGHEIDSVMYRDPGFPVEKVVLVFPTRAKELWLKALKQPSADMRCKAADAFSQAKQRGFTGFDDVIPDLVAALEKEEQSPARIALVRALIDLEAKKSADLLWKQSPSGGIDLRLLIEPALARWDHGPAKDAWVKRLESSATPGGPMLLAIRGSATTRNKSAAEPLRKLAISRASTSVRMEAARALAQISDSGLEKDAASLVKDARPRAIVDRLVAVSLLRRHGSKESIELLRSLARDPEPAVAAKAAERLLEIDAKHLAEARDGLLGSSDPTLRGHGVAVLLKNETADSLGLLGKRLDDGHPAVRVAARRALLERATKRGQQKEVIGIGVGALATTSWRSQEQAAVLLSDLGHKPAAPRLIQLLSSARPEAFLTAAWALRRLGNAETLPAVLKYTEEEYGRRNGAKMLEGREEVNPMLVSQQLSHLIQHLGLMKYAPSEAFLRKFVPRNDKAGINEARAAAVWSLGLLLEGKPSGNLASQLVQRFVDTMSMPPEDGQVRRMCAVTLGRLKAMDSLGTLKKFCPNQEIGIEPINDSCAWAIERITGEKAKKADPRTVTPRDWFLMPID